ncbi:hypothetical protein DMC30DRAFT_181118 [Rhodotorula diobovata]|uniref:Uncharacterized protein n=1 Tax=Rhodotorula diobovata TaxID=5288 RepID=A0A5C5FY73_9BASI|nr:hypothetical protein DMC30DRAFT_181118 [Rhodotorula diobovata]
MLALNLWRGETCAQAGKTRSVAEGARREDRTRTGASRAQWHGVLTSSHLSRPFRSSRAVPERARGDDLGLISLGPPLPPSITRFSLQGPCGVATGSMPHVQHSTGACARSQALWTSLAARAPRTSPWHSRSATLVAPSLHFLPTTRVDVSALWPIEHLQAPVGARARVLQRGARTMTRLELRLPAAALRKLPTPAAGREAHSVPAIPSRAS